MSADAAPLIVSALLGPADFAWADGLRRAHFPPERNLLAAHLTLFHHLPPAMLPELRQRLAVLAASPRPAAQAIGIMNLGRGTAIRIASPTLETMRAEVADAFRSVLTPQDRAGWRPHITIQNKVAASEASALQQELAGAFRSRPVQIDGLAVHYYRDGPWETIGRYSFRR